MRIDINSDTGESFGAYTIGHDEGLFTSITSANVAAGFHAGDPSVLRDTIRLAKSARRRRRRAPGLSRSRRLRPPRAERHAEGSRGHGAVSGGRGRGRGRGGRRDAAARQAARRAVQHGGPQRASCPTRLRAASRRSTRSLILFGLPGSEILNAGRAAGLRVAAEVFADRAYEPDGSLASRRKPGSVIHDPAAVVARAVRMVKERNVVAIDGSLVPLEADTICVHGDTPGSDDLAAKIRAGLEAAGITVKAIGHPVIAKPSALAPSP